MGNTPLYDDKELFRRIATSDEQAFEILYSRYFPRMYPVILQIVKTEAVVRDIIQDVFFRLWLNREKLTEIDQPKHYIFRITYNQSFKQLKKQLVANRVQSEIATSITSTETTPNTEELIDLATARRLIEEAIRELPEQSRKIYSLNRLSGYKPQQIAEELGISVQSVRNSLTQSGKTIRKHLAQKGLILPMVLILLQHS